MNARRTTTLLMVCLCLLGGSFGQTNKAKKSDAKTLSTGVWGGPHLRMEVTASGADLEFDCGEAAISEPITLDASNHFRVSGNVKAGDFGPTRDDVKAEANAVFTGSVEGDTLKMEIAQTGQETPQKYVLTRGREPKLFKCK
jgi:hypothetical protein